MSTWCIWWGVNERMIAGETEVGMGLPRAEDTRRRNKWGVRVKCQVTGVRLRIPSSAGVTLRRSSGGQIRNSREGCLSRIWRRQEGPIRQ
jgi:hypothetical protein